MCDFRANRKHLFGVRLRMPTIQHHSVEGEVLIGHPDQRSIPLEPGTAVLSDATGAMPSSTLVSRTFSTPRQTTHYIECGPADGPLMIFLHGWPSIGLMWRAQMNAFAADGWRCIAPERR